MNMPRRIFLACIVGGAGSFVTSQFIISQFAVDWSGPDVCPTCGPGKHVKRLVYGCRTLHRISQPKTAPVKESNETRYGHAAVYYEYGKPPSQMPGWRCDTCGYTWDAPEPR